MPQFFYDILHKPFGKRIKEEFDRRFSENQIGSNNVNEYIPYFQIKRIAKLSNNKDVLRNTDSDLLNNEYAILGLDSQAQNFEIGGTLNKENYSYGMTTSSVSIDDFTFKNITVNFTIPNSREHFLKFREMWFSWGKPIEYKFGKYSDFISQEDEGDLSPFEESGEGVVSNFSYNTDEQRGSISGVINIIGSEYLHLFASENESNEIYDVEDVIMPYVVSKYGEGSNLENYKKINNKVAELSNTFEGSRYELDASEVNLLTLTKYIDGIQSTEPIIFNSIFNNDNHLKNITNNKSRDFYCIIDQEENKNMQDVVVQNFEDYKQTTIEKKDLLDNNFSFTGLSTEQTFRATRYKESTMDSILESLNDVIYVMCCEVVDNFKNSIDIQRYNEIIEYIEESPDYDEIQLQKIFLSQYRNGEIMREDYGIEHNFYISFKYIEEIYRENFGGVDIEDNEIVSLRLNKEIEIPNLRKFGYGLGTTEIENFVINPYNIKIDGEQPDHVSLGNVYVSAEKILTTCRRTNSLLEFIEELVKDFSKSTRNMIMLEKIIGNEVNDNGKAFSFLTYRDKAYDVQRSESKFSDDEVVIFRPFDYRSKINVISVETDTDEDISTMSFFQNALNYRSVSENLYVMDDGSQVVGNDDVEQGNLNRFPQSDIERGRLNFKKLRDKLLSKIKHNQSRYNRETIFKATEGSNQDEYRNSMISLMLYIKYKFEYQVKKAKMSTGDDAEAYVPSHQLPLRFDMTVDGIANIYAGQLFKIDHDSIPIFIHNSGNLPFCICSNVNHEFSNNTWTTKFSGQYIIDSLVKKQISQNDENIKQVKELNDIEFIIIKQIINIYAKNGYLQ